MNAKTPKPAQTAKTQRKKAAPRPAPAAQAEPSSVLTSPRYLEALAEINRCEQQRQDAQRKAQTTPAQREEQDRRSAFEDRIQALNDRVFCRMDDFRNIAELAAFACDARHHLNEIRTLGEVIPGMGSVLRAREGHAEWAAHRDVSGKVLANLALEMDKFTTELEEQISSLSHAAYGTSPTQEGG